MNCLRVPARVKKGSVESLDLQATQDPPDLLDHLSHPHIQVSLDREALKVQWVHQEDKADQGKMDNLYDYFLMMMTILNVLLLLILFETISNHLSINIVL